MPIEGVELDKLVEKFKEEILPYCSNFSTTNFMGFPDAGNSIAGLSGAIFTDLLQQNLINSSFCAPIATFMEIAVIKWLRELVGYNIKPIKNIYDVGGIITYGGTGSNATAMLLARENHRKNTMGNGVTNPSDYKVIIPKAIGHYSIKSSCMWLGCGDNIIEVPINNFKYDLEKLREVIKNNKGKIMCVVAYVGDSRTMSIENLQGVYEVVKSEDKNIWIHADACHGFSLAFSEKIKNKINGLELFDSISTDPHKVLMIPYTLSALLIKDPEKIKMLSSTSDLIMQEPYAFGQVTPFIGSKSWISLKAWFVLKNLGVKEIFKRLKSSYDGNFKQNVIEYMHTNHLSATQTANHFKLGATNVVLKWERIYYEEGPQSLYEERRGRPKKMKLKEDKKKLNKDIEEDLIAENQRLRMENEYLKKLNALVQERIKRENKKK